MTYLVTGAAGFIGFHVAQRLLSEGHRVVGVDSMNDYYDVGLKRARLAQLTHPAFRFEQMDLADRPATEELFSSVKPERVIHLAAQAGVRYSIKNPYAYLDANLTAFMHILEGARQHNVAHLVYASSSSVYGMNGAMPFSVHDNVDHPLSLYAATKKANELLAHSYSHLYRIPTTGLRFFTVYGPWGRPDMAMYLFAEAMNKGLPINVFNHGAMKRDFTYIDDIVTGVVRCAANIAVPNPSFDVHKPDPATSQAPYRVYNIGNHQPVELMYVIELLEKHLGVKAIKNMMPIQPGDVPATFADIEALTSDVGFHPETSIEDGIAKFVAWYREYVKT